MKPARARHLVHLVLHGSSCFDFHSSPYFLEYKRPCAYLKFRANRGRLIGRKALSKCGDRTKLNEQTTHKKELCKHMIKYFLSKDNGFETSSCKPWTAFFSKDHLSGQQMRVFNQTVLMTSSIRQVFLSPFWIRSSKKLFQTGIKLVQRVSACGNVQLYNYALSIRLKELGPEHVDVAISCNNLSRVHHNQGNLSKARHYYNC